MNFDALLSELARLSDGSRDVIRLCERLAAEGLDEVKRAVDLRDRYEAERDSHLQSAEKVREERDAALARCDRLAQSLRVANHLFHAGGADPDAAGADPSDLDWAIGRHRSAAVRALNRAFEADPDAVHALCGNRVPCNRALAVDPAVVAEVSPVTGSFTVGCIGLINGVLAEAGLPLVAWRWSEDRTDDGRFRLLGFQEYTPGPAGAPASGPDPGPKP